MSIRKASKSRVAILTAGKDRHYSHGLASALMARGTQFDFIGGDDLESPELCNSPQVNFLNLRGEQSLDASLPQKIWRVLIYYVRLLAYAMTARTKIFHILWNNKFELVDRTVLMGFYKLLGKKVVLTAHNVNAGARDGCDSFLNRATLKCQYRLCDQIFVHTTKMKHELISEFGVAECNITLIPFGINNAVPTTGLTSAEARQRLGLRKEDKAILSFGNLAPYKGLEFLAEAFEEISKKYPTARWIIAGRPKGPKSYGEGIQTTLANKPWGERVIKKVEFIADTDVEIYFKAADVLALPYVHIFQSGVLFLSYSFGLPVIATDVGSLKEEIVEGRTGFVCKPKNPQSLARAISVYFQSDLYRELAARRSDIQNFAKEKYSWDKVGAITSDTYAKLLCEIPAKITEKKTNDETFSFNSHSGLQR